MLKILLIIEALLLFCVTSYGDSFSSDTSYGSFSFIEDLSANGDFLNSDERKWLEDNNPRGRFGIWDAGLIFTRNRSFDQSGNEIIDETTEIDLGLGRSRKHLSEWEVTFTGANTPAENLRDFGFGFYYKWISAFGEKEGDYQREKKLKLSLNSLTYTQTYSTSFTSRLGVTRPTTGESSIGQLYPKIEGTLELSEALTLKASYAYYFYNRNVGNFLNTLDNPRAVDVGLGNISGSVSGFNQDIIEADAIWTPVDLWEFDFTATETTSAVNQSAGGSVKGGVLYDLSKEWQTGLAMEYDTNYLFTDHVYTLSFKYDPQ